MSQQQSKLTFFCEMCNKPIDSNICPIHGIDFVTIKKIRLDGNIVSGNGGRRSATRMNKPQVMSDTPKETGLVPLRPGKPPVQETQLPALPGDPRVNPVEDDIHDAEAEPVLPQPNPFKTSQPDPSDGGIPSFQRGRGNEYRQQPEEPGHVREEFVYQEAAEDDVEDYYEPQVTTQVAPASDAGVKGWMVALMAAMVVVLLAAAFYVFNQSNNTPTSLYSEAETLYNNQDLNGAMARYQEFLKRFPENPLVPIVQSKIKGIRQEVRAGNGEMDEEIKILMLAANAAFDKDNYITPKEDNALAHAQKVLEISPNYGPALDLKSKIMRYCEDEAKEALRLKNYNTALSYYQTMSEIIPNNTSILSKIREVLAAKSKDKSR